MGRNAGWLAAAAGLAGQAEDEAPHLTLFPEVPFEEESFLARVREVVERIGFCVVVVSEGSKRPDGRFLAETEGSVDAFGHSQLGGAGPLIAGLVKDKLGFKVHWTVPDYLQRSARHLASKTDFAQAQAVGKAAVAYALAGRNGTMPVIRRLSDAPYRWKVEAAELSSIANHEKKMPAGFIRKDGYGITPACRRYLAPLVRGEAPWRWTREGLPAYLRPPLRLLPARLPPFA
jgi:6-phosphofructokinase 1